MPIHLSLTIKNRKIYEEKITTDRDCKMQYLTERFSQKHKK